MGRILYAVISNKTDSCLSYTGSPKKHFESEQDAGNAFKIPGPGEPYLGGYFIKEPVPPDPLSVTDRKENFSQFMDRSGLIAVVPRVVQSAFRTEGMAQRETKGVKISIGAVDPRAAKA